MRRDSCAQRRHPNQENSDQELPSAELRQEEDCVRVVIDGVFGGGEAEAGEPRKRADRSALAPTPQAPQGERQRQVELLFDPE